MLRALRHRDFRLLCIGQGVSLVGDGMYLVAIAWLVYDISNTPGALAIVGFAWTLPQAAGLLVAGILSDRSERRRLLVAADLIRCAAIGSIAILTLTDTVELFHVVLLVAVYGTGQALFQPAFTAIVPEVVPRDALFQANALRELMEPVGMRFAGPALGGVIIAGFGVGTALLIDAATFAISAAAVVRIRRRPAGTQERGSFRRDLVEGVSYVRAHSWLWVTMASVSLFLLVCYGPFEVLLPYIIRNDMDAGAAAFGTVLAAAGAGSIFAALLVGRIGMPARHVTFMWIAWCVADLLIAALALAVAPWQLCVIAFVSWGFGTAGLIVWNTLLNVLVPSELLGRVSSLDWFLATAAIPLSFALTAPVADLLGAKTTLALGGLLGAATLVFIFVPGVRAPEQPGASHEAVHAAARSG